MKSPGPYLSYLRTRKDFDKSDLTKLYTLMETSRKNLASIRVAQAIAFVSDRENKESVNTIIKYFKKSDLELSNV